MGQQQLPLDQLHAVRNQINALSAPPAHSSAPAPFTLAPQAPQPQYAPPSQQRPLQVAPPSTPGLQASLDSKNLAEIIARAQQAPATPPASQPSLPQPQSTPISNPSTQSAPADLLATLRAKGLLTGDSNTPVNGLAGYPPPSTTNTPPTVPTGLARGPSTNDVELTSASLKRYLWPW